jgi:stage III sporulation protein AA
MGESFNKITDNIDLLLEVLPTRINLILRKHPELEQLREVVLDLGRAPEFRFSKNKMELIENDVIDQKDLDYVQSHVGTFTSDNRAGIERTLHRISAIRNRAGKTIGLTCRVGRAVYGTVDVLKDIIEEGKNLLILGGPGVGKTTKLRELARILSDRTHKRVIVVDTSNEIAGDGDIPHPGIGYARRMQVSSPDRQHAVMIEAVENHMPEVVIVDEIGTEEEAAAARTIAERGVQLIGTAHGTNIKNLIKNPTLSDLVGGVQAVVLGDEEAKRRHTQKTVLERKAPPTFDVLVEIHDRYTVGIYFDVAKVVDELLLGNLPKPEVRRQEPGQTVQILQQASQDSFTENVERENQKKTERLLKIFPYSIHREDLQRAIKTQKLAAEIVDEIADADMVVTIQSQVKKNHKLTQMLAGRKVPIHVLKSNSARQVQRFLETIFKNNLGEEDWVKLAVDEIIEVARQTESGDKALDASPQSAYIRRLQHQYLEEHGFHSESIGEEPNRRVRVYPL